MTRPAPKLLPLVGASVRVVNQVLDALLPSTLKLLWRDHLAFDGGSGCYAGAGLLARRLGISRETVERGRLALERFGLLVIERRGPGLSSTYYATLPADCRPSSATPKDVSAWTDRLEARIRAVRSGVTDAASLEEGVASPATPTGVTGAGRVASPVRVSGVIHAATLASLMTPPRSGNRAQSGGTGAAGAGAPPGVELEGVLEDSSTGSARAPDPDVNVGVPDMYLSLDEQQARRERLRRRAKA